MIMFCNFVFSLSLVESAVNLVLLYTESFKYLEYNFQFTLWGSYKDRPKRAHTRLDQSPHDGSSAPLAFYVIFQARSLCPSFATLDRVASLRKAVVDVTFVLLGSL